MNAKAAKRIRYAAECMHGSGKYRDLSERQQAAKKKTVNRLKAEYKATPFHRRHVHQESHSFVLQVKYGKATRKYPA